MTSASDPPPRSSDASSPGDSVARVDWASGPHLESLLTAGHVGLLLIDENGELVDVNEAARFLLGRPIEELRGYCLGTIPGQRTGESRPIEINCISDDGRIRYCELRVHSDLRLPSAAGLAAAAAGGDSLPGVSDRTAICTLYDITPYRDAARSARAEVVRRDDFLATLSHELRNPLSAVTSGFELLRSRSTEEAIREETAAVVEQQLSQLRRLLDDLLDMTRLTRRQFSIRAEPIDLRHPIQAAYRMSTMLRDPSEQATEEDSSITAPETSTTLHLPETPVAVDADVARIEQMTANLICNAIKYTQETGTVTVSLEIAAPGTGLQPPAEQSVEAIVAEHGIAQLIVADNGAGIDDALIAHLFDPFVQAQRTFGRSDGGFGIGLTLVRDIVRLHGGRVWAESPGRDQGSRFIVQLPMVDVAASELKNIPRDPLPETPPPKLRVLLVEDVPAIRKVTRRLLERFGYEVATAADAPTAIAAVEREQFDLGLVDIGLPGPSGLTVAEYVRSNRTTADMRLVALTGYGQKSDRLASIQAGFDRHLVKPFDLNEFRTVVTELFGSRVR